jgi:hypothetical protein
MEIEDEIQLQPEDPEELFDMEGPEMNGSMVDPEMRDEEQYAWKSATLLKITQARISDMRELVDRKTRVKHADDPWWESRNPKVYDKSPKKYADVQSRLNRSTAAYEQSRRPKASLNNTEPPSFSFGGGAMSKKPPSPEKVLSPPKSANNSSRVIKPIGHDSHLLKPTSESQQSCWHGKSDRLSIERTHTPGLQLETRIKGSGPKDINSRLSVETMAVASSKWKSKEDLSAEEKKHHEQLHCKQTIKIQATSAKLLKPTVAMKHNQTTKRGKLVKDAREEGWNVFGITKDTQIPEVDLGQPYARRTPNKNDSGRKIPKSPETDNTSSTPEVNDSPLSKDGLSEDPTPMAMEGLKVDEAIGGKGEEAVEAVEAVEGVEAEVDADPFASFF